MFYRRNEKHKIMKYNNKVNLSIPGLIDNSIIIIMISNLFKFKLLI